jgi:hypothetical protein
MSPPARELSEQHRKELARAHHLLERNSLAKRVAEYASGPVNSALRQAPKSLRDAIDKAIHHAISASLKLAIRSLKHAPARKPQMRLAATWAGVAGGLAGALGAAALPLELPLTTILMLRAIADIAQHYGEDLSKLEARLACVEVFAYGAERRADIGYYASRAMLGRLAGEAAAVLAQRGATHAAAPAVTALSKEIASRFGLVVWDKLATSAIPIAGAVSAATINVAFMNHFQAVARGHFMVRRLERTYGAEMVREAYRRLEAAGERPA